MSARAVVFGLLLSLAAAAEEPPPLTTDEQKALEKALSTDAAADAATQQTRPGAPPLPLRRSRGRSSRSTPTSR
ncbi:MAG: hypothetical protein EXR72_00325 [Myxococcales bacterium]|nr:hypothetical protein [Myxococcales bacterium]